ncbi:MAG: hypothetical protein H7246_00530 [Phycisphaerae bacterium]|nr:hypothetical protein [Saprospiraceae bacterium]
MKNFASTPLLAVPFFLSALALGMFFGLANPSKGVAQACTLVCTDQLTVVVPTNGSVEFFPEDIAEGDLSQSCPNGIFQTQVLINSVWQNASGNFVFDNSHIGNTYIARLRDQNSGNACFGTVIVQAAPPVVDTVHFQLCAKYWKDDRPIKGAMLTFQPSNPAFPYLPIVTNLDTSQSCANMTVVLSDYLPGTTFGYSASILPDTNYLNGVSVVDLCKIAHHILGINPLPSPYAMFAADANKSNSITTFDVVEFKKLILGVYNQLPNHTSWRFIADYCHFPNPNNPFQNVCASGISDTELAMLDGGIAKVIGVKIGDVDGDARLNGELYVPPIATDSITLLLPQGQLTAGVPVAVPVKFDKNLALGSLQAQFFLDPALAQYDSISDGQMDVNASFAYYNAATGRLKFTSLGYSNLFAQAGVPLFYIHFKPLQAVNLTTVLKVVHDDPNSRTFAIGDDCATYYTIGSAYSGFVPTISPELRGLRIQAPSPNPFGEQTFLEIELESAETAVLEVVDLTGRTVFSEEKNLPSGVYHWEIPGSALISGSLGIWRLRVGEQMMVGKITRY